MPRVNYYKELTANYSKPGLISKVMSDKLLSQGEKITKFLEATQPEIGITYSFSHIERENKEWWPTHCEALRKGRVDILKNEYRENVVYLTQQGPFYGKGVGSEASWWKLLAQNDVTMVWPVVMFSCEVVYFEWMCLDDNTGEITAKGNVTWLRRGHRGGCHLKTEKLEFYRDVTAEFFSS